MADDDDIIQSSQRQHRGKAGRDRSPARQWVEENYDKLVATPPHWPTLAARLNSAGRLDGKVTARQLTKAFSLVNAERKKQAGK